MKIPNLEILLSEIHTRQPIIISNTVSMRDAARKMSEGNADAVFVKLSNDTSSIITKNDFVRIVEKGTDASVLVGELVSNRSLVTIGSQDTVVDAIIRFKQNNIKHLPIVSKNGEIEKYLTLDDVKEQHDFIFSHMCDYNVIENQQVKKFETTIKIIEKRKDCKCAILLFAATDTLGKIIDLATGSCGYSHVAIDCCEVDKKTGKPQMIEATGDGVKQANQDKYGDRRVERIELNISNCDEFCKKVNSMREQPYDILEAITFGLIDDPKKQICSGLAKNALKQIGSSLLAELLKKADKLPKGSVIRHRNGNVFVSPNGWAKLLGAPDLTPGSSGIDLDFSGLGGLFEKIGCKGQITCYDIKMSAANIQISNIVRDNVVPGIGCLAARDFVIKSKATDQINEKMEEMSTSQKCPDGCGCLSPVTIGPVKLSHYSEHKKVTLVSLVGIEACKLEFDVDFDIMVTASFGVCIPSAG